MKILCIAQVENETHILKEIQKQTVQPDQIVIYRDEAPATGINNRRRRIAVNHTQLQKIVKEHNPELVWQLEQDAVLPENALETLIQNYQSVNAAYVSGIQIGRHGIRCIGAWHIKPDEFISVHPASKGLVEVDATGFYCLLANATQWLSGKCWWRDEPYGPDVNWGLSIKGKKYVNMDLHIGHRVENGIIKPDTTTVQVRFFKQDEGWKYRIV